MNMSNALTVTTLVVCYVFFGDHQELLEDCFCVPPSTQRKRPAECTIAAHKYWR